MKSSTSSKKEIDYLSLTPKEKFRMVIHFVLKWGAIIVGAEGLIGILLELLTNYSGYSYFTTWLLYLPAVLLIYGGCVGGLSRYHVPPKLRIIEPDDQTVVPDTFQIRVRYDQNKIVPETIQIMINDKKVASKLKEGENIVYVPQIFKNPPKKAVTLAIKTIAYDTQNKEFKDQIRIICDPDADKEDYEEYWEFKREDETYWGKEMVAAQKHEKRMMSSYNTLALALVLFVVNIIVSQIYVWIVG